MGAEKYLPPIRDDNGFDDRIRNLAVMYYDDDVCNSVKIAVKQIVEVILSKIDTMEDNEDKERVFRTMLFMVSKQVINNLFLKESVACSADKEKYNN